MVACSMHQRGSAKGRSSPKRSTSETTVTPGRSMSRDDVRVGVAGDDDDRLARRGGELAHAADDLALEALRIEVALTGHDRVGGGDLLRQLDVLGHQLEPGHDPTAERRQTAGEPAAAPPPTSSSTSTPSSAR